MIKRIASAVFGVAMLVLTSMSTLRSNPSFNGTTAGCSGGGCHSRQTGIVTAVALGGLQVRITLSGTTSRVAGDLTNSSGAVVAFNNQTTSNPFTLTAPSAGSYVVYAGFNSPNRRWDSVRVNVTTTGVGEFEKHEAPMQMTLNQNYPNPFNPSTTIEFQNVESGYVTLKVFDISGKELATVLSGLLSAGVHRANFNASNLSSGIYLYRLTTSSGSQTRKMVLSK